MHAPLHDCRGVLLPAAITLPSLRDGNVQACLGTIFTEGVSQPTDRQRMEPYEYPFGDSEAASAAAMRQLKLYHVWREAGLIELIPPRGLHANRPEPARDASDSSPLRLGILMECADPIIDPDRLETWADAGVIAIGMAWWHQGRYAGGNGSDNTGLTELGRDLVPRMDELGIVHDASHLSQRSLDELLALTDRPVIASHSNCRALMPGNNHRHLDDASITAIAHRGGIIGINLVSNFLNPALADTRTGSGARASIDHVVAHIEHACSVADSRAHVALGSDMDGGFTASGLPEGLEQPTHLARIAEALSDSGWSDAEIQSFAWSNWARFWELE